MEPNSLVWVKIPDYPWWPALVLDPSVLIDSGIEMPSGKDTVVQFLHTQDTGFVEHSNSAEVIPFDLSDPSKLTSEDENCSAAIAAALSMWNAAVEQVNIASQSEEVVNGDDEERRRHKKDKKDKKHKKDKKDKKDKRDKKKKEHRREKRRRDDSSDDGAASSDEEDDNEDEGSHHHRRGKQSTKSRTALQRDKERHTHNKQGPSSSSTAKTAIASHVYMNRFEKPVASDELLVSSRRKLEAFMELGDQQSIRMVLSDLAKVQVTVKQLKVTQIGVVVGRLLGADFPLCKLLADAILKFWFACLPQTFKDRMNRVDEVDRASNISQGGDDDSIEEMAQLHSYGVQIESCFMVEENELNAMGDDVGSDVEGDTSSRKRTTPTTAAPAADIASQSCSVSGAHIAKCIEIHLEKESEDLKQFVLSFLKNCDHREARLALLEGKKTPETFVDELIVLFERHEQINNAGDLDETAAAPPVLTEGEEGDFDNVTHMLQCPKCGQHSAYTSEVLVGGHGEDHVSKTWATCTSCSNAWFVGE